MSRKAIQRTVLWVLTVSVAGVIFWLSGQTAEQSGSLSGEVTNGLLGQLFVWLRFSAEQRETAHELLRSLAHVALFALLGLCASLLAKSYDLRHWKPITASSCVLYAVLDECHQQWFSVGRAFEWADIVKDSVGVLLGIGMTALLYFCRRTRSKKGV